MKLVADDIVDFFDMMWLRMIGWQRDCKDVMDGRLHDDRFATCCEVRCCGGWIRNMWKKLNDVERRRTVGEEKVEAL